jgi:tetratricopeptide (TPR) repeat protein
MKAVDELMRGNFAEAIIGFKQELLLDPNSIVSVDGLSKALQGAGKFQEALPFLQRVHTYQKENNPGAPGQLLAISCANWCIGDQVYAIELARELCDGILNGSISMAPDQVSGTTFGLILHYMSITAKDKSNYDYALEYLGKLNDKYDKQQARFQYPIQTVKQILGELRFEDALEGATKERVLAVAFNAAKSNLLVL